MCCSCGVSLGMGDPCSKTPFWMPSSSVWASCCISSVHHVKLHAWGRLWQRAEVWEVCHRIMALKPEHNPPKEARISNGVTPFYLSSYMVNALHANHPSESKARVSVSLGLKVRVAENLLPTRKAHYWIRASARHHSLWPEESWPTSVCSFYSKYCSKKFWKVSR